MSFHHQTERREFVRISSDVPVRYKFLSKTVPVDGEGIYEGTTNHVSGHGMLLVGKIPGLTWIPGLLMEEIILGVNILLPSTDIPIKALARVAWVESITKGSDKCPMGLHFKEVSKESQDELLKYVIKVQIAH